MRTALLCALAAGAAGWQLPDFYTRHRTHAHTRLSINSFCNATCCKPVFENAAELFASLGVRAYVRHTHTASEGLWWPSTSDPPAAWHPLVRATNRSFPAEFLAKAKAAGIEVIFYHYMKCSEYYATTKPEWVQRWPNGSAVEWQRGVGLSPCADDWVDTYIAQAVQLAEMGARAFYFDEYPASPGGDWNDHCKAKFKERFGEEMPTALKPGRSPEQPMAVDRRIPLLMTQVTQEYFDKLAAALSAVEKKTAALISILRVPKVDDGNAIGMSGLYETTQLLQSPNGVAKTEIEIPAKGSRAYGGDAFEEMTMMGFGYTMARDGADGRPSHTWIPHLVKPEHAVCSSAALLTYGMVANPDHTESRIPDFALYNSTYRFAAEVDSKVFSAHPDLEPHRWAAVLWAEKSRNVHFPNQHVEAWKIIFPSLGLFETLLKAGMPTAQVMDWQLEANPKAAVARFPVIVSPPAALLINSTRSALNAYAAAGGHVIAAAETDRWNDTKARPHLGASVLEALERAVGPAAAQVVTTGGGALPVHAVMHSTEDGALFVFITNNFTHCMGGSKEPAPAPAQGLAVRLPYTGTPPVVTDVLTGATLPTHSVSVGGAQRWQANLPSIEVFAVVEVRAQAV